MNLIFKFAFILCCLSCSHDLIERSETADDNIYVNTGRGGQAFTKNVYAELSIRRISEKEIKQILSNKYFTSNSNYRIPRLLFFMLTIKNSTDFPLFFVNGNILYKTTRHAALDTRQFRQKFTSSMYDPINFDALTAARRLILPDYEFDFMADTINYKLDFILPNETIAKVIVFDYPPLPVTDYRLEFILKTRNMPKVIGINMKRSEYRTKGNYFIRKRDIDEDFL